MTALLVLTFIYFDRLVAMLRGLVADVSIGIGTGGAGGFTTLVDTTGTTTDNTDVNFAHRYLYTGDGGDVAVRFESGGTAYTFTLPAGGLLPINLYSIDSFTGSDIHLFR